MSALKLRQIEVENKRMEPQFNTAEEQFKNLIDQLSQRAVKRDFQLSEIEELIASEGREVLRRLLEETLRNAGTGEVEGSVQNEEGVLLPHKRLRPQVIKTTLGEVSNERIGYSAKEEESVFPKDIQLNLADSSYSHPLRKRVASEVSRNSFSIAAEAIFETQGVKIHSRQIEEISLSAAVDFDEFYQQQQKLKDQAVAAKLPLLVLSTDGKGIVMRKEDLTKETQARAKNKVNKLDHRLSKGEKLNGKRMATAAAVYSIDRFIRTPEEVIGDLDSVEAVKAKTRPKPVCKRVWASIEHSNQATLEHLFEEGIRRDTKLKKTWVMLVDGDPRQLKRIKKLIKKTNRKTTLILDIIHVIEYLWKAARVLHPEASPECELWVKDKLHEILQGNVGHAAAGMRRSATLRNLSQEMRRPLDQCAGYLLKYSLYMKYHEYLSEGFPIATGVIEGVCRHVIKDRMDITGARWSLAGAESVLKLRSLKSSGDFEEYWTFHEKQEHKRNYGNLAIINNIDRKD